MFLETAPESDAVRDLYEGDRKEGGFVMNFSRLWAWRPDFLHAFSAARAVVVKDSTLTRRELAVLVCATASSLGDSYCSFAWGERLAALSDEAVAAAVIAGLPGPGMTPRERVLMEWARKVVRLPNHTSPADVQSLRAGGLTEKEIFEATAFVALRLAFSTLNDALGAAPDRELVDGARPMVRAAVNFGRLPR